MKWKLFNFATMVFCLCYERTFESHCFRVSVYASVKCSEQKDFFYFRVPTSTAFTSHGGNLYCTTRNAMIKSLKMSAQAIPCSNKRRHSLFSKTIDCSFLGLAASSSCQGELANTAVLTQTGRETESSENPSYESLPWPSAGNTEGLNAVRAGSNASHGVNGYLRVGYNAAEGAAVIASRNGRLLRLADLWAALTKRECESVGTPNFLSSDYKNENKGNDERVIEYQNILDERIEANYLNTNGISAKNINEPDVQAFEYLGSALLFGRVAGVRTASCGGIHFCSLRDSSCWRTLQVVVPQTVLNAANRISFREGVGSLTTEDRYYFKGNSFVQTVESKPTRPLKGEAFLVSGDVFLARDRPHVVEIRATELWRPSTALHSHREISDWKNYDKFGSTYSGNILPNSKSMWNKFCFEGKTSLLVLREQGALCRFADRRLQAILRIRNRIERSMQRILEEEGFMFVRSPVLTSLDCEGGAQTFWVSHRPGEKLSGVCQEPVESGSEDKILPGGNRECLTDSEPSKKSFHYSWISDKNAPNLTGVDSTDVSKTRNIPSCSHLSVSAQFALESLCLSLGPVYTIAPAFRAENFNTTRHLQEFWMLEVEAPYLTAQECKSLLARLVKESLGDVIEANDDLKEIFCFSSDQLDAHIKLLKSIVDIPFADVSYSQALRTLEDVKSSKLAWGDDLGASEEKKLVDLIGNGRTGVYVHNHPRCLKPFYMRKTDSSPEDGNHDDHQKDIRSTVESFDLLLPNVGEAAGGSEREERFEYLKNNIPSSKPYEEYLKLRIGETTPHAGFGLGVERLVMLAAGIGNVKDTIPFPRSSARSYM